MHSDYYQVVLNSGCPLLSTIFRVSFTKRGSAMFRVSFTKGSTIFTAFRSDLPRPLVQVGVIHHFQLHQTVLVHVDKVSFTCAYKIGIFNVSQVLS